MDFIQEGKLDEEKRGDKPNGNELENKMIQLVIQI